MHLLAFICLEAEFAPHFPLAYLVWPEYVTSCWPTAYFPAWALDHLLLNFGAFFHSCIFIFAYSSSLVYEGRAVNTPPHDIGCYVRKPKNWSVCVNLVLKIFLSNTSLRSFLIHPDGQNLQWMGITPRDHTKTPRQISNDSLVPS